MVEAAELKNYRRRIERVRQNVTMAMLVKHYGGRIWNETRPCQIRCIFLDHDDLHPSARIFPDSNVLHCFVCGFHGDVLDVVQRYHQIDRLAALQYLEETFNLEDELLPEPKGSWSIDTLDRKIHEDIHRVVSNRLWEIFAQVPERKRYIWWIWSDWIYEMYDNANLLGGYVPWYNAARRCINKYLVPLMKEPDELVVHGGIHVSSS